ncbi:MAG: MFS transporter [Planctomycetota bacterium]|nr:MFS transporter [Planctomycetota bacterium]
MSNDFSTSLPHTDRPTQFRKVVFVLACGTSWMLYLHRYVFGLIKPKLETEFGLTETELGLLDSGFSIFYAGSQVPMGLAIDSVGVRYMLTLSIYVWCVGLAMHALATGTSFLVGGRIVLGVGQSGVYAALSRVTRNWFPAASRTTVQGWVGVFFGRIGGVSANLLVATVMIGVYGFTWRLAVYILAMLGLAHALAFFLSYRNSPREHPLVNQAETALIEETPASKESGERTPAPRMKIREMFSRMSKRSTRNLFWLNGQTILSTIADNIFSAWIPLFLFKVHDLQFKEMGIYSALPLLGGACGGACGGWLNDFMIRRMGDRRRARSTVGLAGKGMAAVLLLTSLIWYDDPYRFCIMLFFVKFFSDWSLTTTWGVVTDIGGQSTATVFAWNNAIATTGAIVAPILYGAIAEHASWKWVFVTGAAAYILCALSWLKVDCSIPVIDDSEKEVPTVPSEPEDS